MFQTILSVITSKAFSFVSIGLLLISIFFGIKYFSLYNSEKELNTELQTKYEQQMEENAANLVSISNLKSAINEQNQKIEEFKQQTSDMQTTISDLNKKTTQYNKKKANEELESAKDVKTDNEAVEWLKSKASSLQSH